jgi:DNA-binding transcriptional ArsR family regulator
MALSLIPAVGWSPSFLGPALTGPPEELLEVVRATPTRVVATEMALVAEHQPLPSWARDLPRDLRLRTQVIDGLGSLYAALIDPYWPALTSSLTAELAVRMRQLLSGGVDRLLSQLNPPWARWTPPVLELRMPNRVDHDLYLEGTGLLLVPSVFGSRCIVDDDARPQPVVTFPVGQAEPARRLTALVPRRGTSGPARTVAALLGHTRAAVLTTIAEHPSCSTKELATLVGIAPASASEHATTLREAGLIRTGRHRNMALHSPTDLGIALLDARGVS